MMPGVKRAARFVVDQHIAEQELIPGGDEAEDRVGEDAWGGQRNKDAIDEAEPRAAVELRRLVEFDGYRVEEALEHEAAQRRGEGAIDQGISAWNVDSRPSWRMMM